VIDDASHRLEPTRASLETLFPRLREGGLFLIEDWRWQIRRAVAVAERLTDAESPARERFERRLRQAGRSGGGEGRQSDAPLPALVIELMLAKAESDEFVSELTVGPSWVTVERGPGELDAAFRLADVYTDRMGLLAAREDPG